MIVHLNCNLLEDITGNEVVDCLPVVISGSGFNQLIGVPKLDCRTGSETADVVHQALLIGNCKITDRKLLDEVKGLCFDTTASNTVLKNGACVLFKQKLEKDLLLFICRHQIPEIMLETVVSSLLQASLGPDI